MCFTPQGCAPFRHLNIQKWSETNSFYLFQLRNVLRATTARYFPTSQHPKVLREWGVFNMLTSMCNVWTSQRSKVLRHWGAFSFLTSKSASRHNRVQFFIAHPAASLRNKTLEKQCLATYLPFAHLDLLSTDSFSSFPFPSNSYCSHPCCCIHPASRGVAAHTAGLFRSVRGAKGGFPPKLGNFHFSPPWGLPKLGNFHFSPPWGLPKLGNFHFSPPWGLPKLWNFHFSPPWQLPKLWNFHFSLPWRLSKLRNFK